MSVRCYLNLYLHMHQPYYKNLGTGDYAMPWARLHALKNYADMPSLHARYEGLKISYNLVPSLLVQLEDYASGATDSFETVSRVPAAQLSQDQKRFILSNFFQLNRSTQIDVQPAFRQLLGQKGSQQRDVGPEAVDRFTEEDFRDLQVHFNLAWSGWLLQDKPHVQKLLKKGKHFSEAEKIKLLDLQRTFLGTVLEPYRTLQQRGMAELTASPFYHPILPLLCNLESAREAVSDLPLPDQKFSRPDDARLQVRKGLDYLESTLGRRPAGMWPSEGSVSSAACSIMAAEGVVWAATDQNVLAGSLGHQPSAEELYSPHRFTSGEGDLILFFRDTQLSDALGFVYQSWEPQRAADDFIGRLKSIADSHSGQNPPVVSVILDGENAWSHYPDNGRAFLTALYERLAGTAWLQTATPSELLSFEQVRPRPLQRLQAGSWIYGTLTTWIGHAEKNQGWDVLATARNAFEKQRNSLSKEQRELALEELLIAEGSDWFWWYGDDHVTTYAREFDALFRDHLANAYRHMGMEPPANLGDQIKKVLIDESIQQPLRIIRPRIQGWVNHFDEWRNAGMYVAHGGAGSMHQVSESIIESIFFGFDEANIYLRLDAEEPLNQIDCSGMKLKVNITAPDKAEVTWNFKPDTGPVLKREGSDTVELEYGFENILELALPRTYFPEAALFSFYIVLEAEDNEIERHPRGRSIELQLGGEEFDMVNWSV